MREGGRTVRVAAAVDAGPVRHLRLVAADGIPLPGYVPGSHIVIEAGTATNAYSLTGEFLAPEHYAVSVLRLPEGRGGSRFLHDRVAVGDLLTVSEPRSAFAPVATARRHLMIAGGIGVTPILSHVRAALRYGREFEVIYAQRAGLGAPHARELIALAGAERCTLVSGRAALGALLDERLGRQPLGTVLYTCGPAAMMEHVCATAAAFGWPGARIRTEAFSAAALDPGEPFVARLERSGRHIEVAAGVSLLEALEQEGLAVPNMCRQGVCGECRLPVSSGEVEHRDLYLSDSERAAGDTLMCCVSRARGGVVELAL